MRGPVAHPDAEAEAPARQLVDEGGGVGEVVGVPRVDIGDAGAERDGLRDLGDALAEREPVVHARAVDAGIAFLFDALGQLEGGAPTPRHSGEAQRGLAGHQLPPVTTSVWPLT